MSAARHLRRRRRREEDPIDTGINVPPAYKAIASGALWWPWHVKGKQHEPGSLHATRGLYDSTDPATAAYHAELTAQKKGNLVAVSCWGRNAFSGRSRVVLHNYGDAAVANGLKWLPYWEATTLDTWRRDLDDFREDANRPGWLQIQGKPALPMYGRVVDILPDAEFLAAAQDFYLCPDAPFRADEYQQRKLAWNAWNVAFTDPAKLQDKYAAVHAAGIPWLAFVLAGMNSLAVTGRGASATVWPSAAQDAYKPGASPEWLDHQIDVTIPHEPTIVLTSGNELGERSAVEPTEEFGTSLTDAWEDMNEEFLGLVA